MLSILSILMGPSINTIILQLSRRIIRVFLNNVPIIDTCFHKQNKVPCWVLSYNLICPLNLPKVSSDYTFGFRKNIFEMNYFELSTPIIFSNPFEGRKHIMLHFGSMLPLLLFSNVIAYQITR